MEWFRHYHGLCTDPKLHIIARNAKVPRGLIVGAWCAILEQASQASDRGDVSDVTPVSLAFLIDVKPHVAERIFEAIWASDLVAENRVSAWEKRQKSSDDVQKRVYNFRARKAKPLADNKTGSAGNVTKSPREEKNREDKKETPNGVSKEAAPDGAANGQAVGESLPSKPLPLKERYPTKGKLPRNGRGIEYPVEFEAVFQAYPVVPQDKTGKQGCYEHWRKAVVDERIPPERILEGAEAFAFVWAGQEYRIGLRRWLAERSWNYQVPKPGNERRGIAESIREANARERRGEDWDPFGVQQQDTRQGNGHEIEHGALPGVHRDDANGWPESTEDDREGCRGPDRALRSDVVPLFRARRF